MGISIRLDYFLDGVKLTSLVVNSFHGHCFLFNPRNELTNFSLKVTLLSKIQVETIRFTMLHFPGSLSRVDDRVILMNRVKDSFLYDSSLFDPEEYLLIEFIGYTDTRKHCWCLGGR